MKKPRTLADLLKPDPRRLAAAILTKLPPTSIPSGEVKIPVEANEAPTDFATNQVQLNSKQAALIVTQRDDRAGIKLTNLSTIDIWILTDPQKYQSGASLQLSGDLLPAGRGQWIWVPVKAAVWGVSQSGTPLISYLEIYGSES